MFLPLVRECPRHPGQNMLLEGFNSGSAVFRCETKTDDGDEYVHSQRVSILDMAREVQQTAVTDGMTNAIIPVDAPEAAPRGRRTKEGGEESE